MTPFYWALNTLRNVVRNTFINRTIIAIHQLREPARICVVSATRLSENDFWSSSALGQSLTAWLNEPSISCDIYFQNQRGLPQIYNAHLGGPNRTDIAVFIHDDVWLDDRHWIDKLRIATNRYDVVGIAGNTRISKDQPAWLFQRRDGDAFVWDHGFLSGEVGHGRQPMGQISTYGRTPARCELLDGAFLAVRCNPIIRSQVTFDELFDFHFYDMDFCRSARRKGLALGTWPIAVTHQSGGAFGSSAWEKNLVLYLRKWKH